MTSKKNLIAPVNMETGQYDLGPFFPSRPFVPLGKVPLCIKNGKYTNAPLMQLTFQVSVTLRSCPSASHCHMMTWSTTTVRSRWRRSRQEPSRTARRQTPTPSLPTRAITPPTAPLTVLPAHTTTPSTLLVAGRPLAPRWGPEGCGGEGEKE